MARDRRIVRWAGAALAAAALFAAGGLAASPHWRGAVQRAVTPTPAPPLLPARTVAYGTDYDEYVHYLEQATWPAREATTGQLASHAGRLRGYTYLWPRDVPLGGGVTELDPVPGTLHGDLHASATRRGWEPVEVHGTYPLAAAFAFRRRGHTFAVVAMKPNAYEFFPGGGRAVSVPIFGRPGPPEGARETDHVPLHVFTDTFDPEGTSYPRSVIAPFLRPESSIRMQRRTLRDAELVDRATWQNACGPGAPLQRTWAPCPDLRPER